MKVDWTYPSLIILAEVLLSIPGITSETFFKNHTWCIPIPNQKWTQNKKKNLVWLAIFGVVILNTPTGPPICEGFSQSYTMDPDVTQFQELSFRSFVEASRLVKYATKMQGWWRCRFNVWLVWYMFLHMMCTYVYRILYYAVYENRRNSHRDNVNAGQCCSWQYTSLQFSASQFSFFIRQNLNNAKMPKGMDGNLNILQAKRSCVHRWILSSSRYQMRWNLQRRGFPWSDCETSLPSKRQWKSLWFTLL